MPFKNKKSKPKYVKHGLCSKESKDENEKLQQAKRRWWRLYEEKERPETLSSPPGSAVPASSSSSPSSTLPSSLPSSPSTSPPGTPKRKSSRRLNLRSDERPQGRPSLFEDALTPEEHNERKRQLYEAQKKKEEKSEKCRQSVMMRWHKERFVSPVENPGAEGSAAEEEEQQQEEQQQQEEMVRGEEVEELVVISRVEDAAVDGDATGAPTLDENDGGNHEEERSASIPGMSQASKSRARNFLESLLGRRAPLEEVDLIRQLSLDFQKRGYAPDGISPTSRSPVSGLFDYQLRYASKNVLDRMSSTASLRHWLPALLHERLDRLEPILGRLDKIKMRT